MIKNAENNNKPPVFKFCYTCTVNKQVKFKKMKCLATISKQCSAKLVAVKELVIPRKTLF